MMTPRPAGRPVSAADRNRQIFERWRIEQILAAHRRPTLGARAAEAIHRLDNNQNAKLVAGGLGFAAGLPIGVGRGLWHSVEGLADAAQFGNRLLNPLDILVSPPGQSAQEQLLRTYIKAGKYMGSRAANPKLIENDLRKGIQQANVSFNPAATPTARTLGDEFMNKLGVGMNDGELVYDGGTLLVGGAGLKVASKLGKIARVAEATGPEKWIAKGFTPKEAAYLDEAYPPSGKGSHFLPERFNKIKKEYFGVKVPENLVGQEILPRSVMDSQFNVLRPEGISRGDFYELHARGDRKASVNRMPRDVGKAWTRKRAGVEAYGLPGRLWVGSPPPLKLAVGGAAAGGGLFRDVDEPVRQ